MMQIPVNHLSSSFQATIDALSYNGEPFLDAALYTDSAWLEREQHHIFWKTWLYVGDENECSQPDRVTMVEVAGYSVLITRNADGG